MTMTTRKKRMPISLAQILHSRIYRIVTADPEGLSYLFSVAIGRRGGPLRWPKE